MRPHALRPAVAGVDMAEHALDAAEAALVDDAFHGQRGGEAAQVEADEERITVANHLLIQLHSLLPGEGHGFFEEDGDAPLQRGERVFDVVDGVAGDEYEVEVGRIGQQLAVVSVEGAAKASFFLGGGIARVGHGDAADLRILHRLETVHVVASAAAEADDGETNCWCCHSRS